jgi:hypothetical protein
MDQPESKMFKENNSFSKRWTNMWPLFEQLSLAIINPPPALCSASKSCAVLDPGAAHMSKIMESF